MFLLFKIIIAMSCIQESSIRHVDHIFEIIYCLPTPPPPIKQTKLNKKQIVGRHRFYNFMCQHNVAGTGNAKLDDWLERLCWHPLDKQFEYSCVGKCLIRKTRDSTVSSEFLLEFNPPGDSWWQVASVLCYYVSMSYTLLDHV